MTRKYGSSGQAGEGEADGSGAGGGIELRVGSYLEIVLKTY